MSGVSPSCPMTSPALGITSNPLNGCVNENFGLRTVTVSVTSMKRCGAGGVAGKCAAQQIAAVHIGQAALDIQRGANKRVD